MYYWRHLENCAMTLLALGELYHNTIFFSRRYFFSHYYFFTTLLAPGELYHDTIFFFHDVIFFTLFFFTTLLALRELCHQHGGQVQQLQVLVGSLQQFVVHYLGERKKKITLHWIFYISCLGMVTMLKTW